MKNTSIKIFAGVAYVAMVIVNFLANSLPINNRSTGAISDAYPNLFAPAGPAFSIWGLIYLLLGIYVIYQFVKKDQGTEEIIQKINPFFIAHQSPISLGYLLGIMTISVSRSVLWQCY